MGRREQKRGVDKVTKYINNRGVNTVRNQLSARPAREMILHTSMLFPRGVCLGVWPRRLANQPLSVGKYIGWIWLDLGGIRNHNARHIRFGAAACLPLGRPRNQHWQILAHAACRTLVQIMACCVGEMWLDEKDHKY